MENIHEGCVSFVCTPGPGRFQQGKGGVAGRVLEGYLLVTADVFGCLISYDAPVYYICLLFKLSRSRVITGVATGEF